MDVNRGLILGPRMFFKKDIVQFVREVGKHPCLYDKTLPEYAIKSHNRRAWAAIAKGSNTTITDCRERWRKIRISFMRSLKQQASDKQVRPYYLAEELHFLRPFIKVSIPLTKSDKEPIIIKSCTIEKQEITDSDTSDSYEHHDGTPELLHSAHNNTILKTPNVRPDNLKQNGYNEDESPRKMFLLSMLPDVESLTEPEMRIFRREVISTIDKIISQRSIRN